ncbi:MAG: hypothetical protein MUQ13_04355, partial [Loktanella sp.]|nr:hypothetical protein [Loktanella sp.]
MAKIEVENVNAPDHKVNLNAEKYGAMFDAMMAVISSEPMTYAAIKEGVLPILSQEHFPEGKTSGWWIKAVQLDLEAKGVVVRHKSKPLTWSKG